MNKTKFPIMLYGFECGQFTWRIYSGLMPSVMQSEWCRRRILDIRWHYFVRNVDIRSGVVNYFWGGTPFTQMISGKVGTMIQ